MMGLLVLFCVSVALSRTHTGLPSLARSCTSRLATVDLSSSSLVNARQSAGLG